MRRLGGPFGLPRGADGISGFPVAAFSAPITTSRGPPPGPVSNIFSASSLRPGDRLSPPLPCLSLPFSPLQLRGAGPPRAVHGPRLSAGPGAGPRRGLPQVRAAPAPGHQPRRRPPAPAPPAWASLSATTHPENKRKLSLCVRPHLNKRVSFILSALGPTCPILSPSRF